jgi:hypothetical protein
MQKHIIFWFALALMTASFVPLSAQSSDNIGLEDEDFAYSSSQGVHLGGYGELHYNYKSTETGEVSSVFDFHRFVIFFGYTFNEQWSMFSEIEIEHNFVQDGQGYLALEQAYLAYQPFDWMGFQVGVLLPSVGIINETHEPPTFLSVERPIYSRNIIPTTWYGNGVSVYGNISGLQYRLVAMEGLDGSKFNKQTGIRSGRGRGFYHFDNAKYLLYNLALDYTGISGLRIGGSATYNNSLVETDGINDINNPILLLESHIQFKFRGLITTFEFGHISYGNPDVLDLQASFGYYLEAGYNIGYLFGWRAQLIPFVRWSHIDTAWKTYSGTDEGQKRLKLMGGISFLPIENISLKIDFANEIKGSSPNTSQTFLLNIGMGYMI